MSKIKYKSGYKRPSLARPADTPEHATGRELAYKAWLLGRELTHVNSCHSSADFKAWRTWIDDNMTPEAQGRLDALNAAQWKIERRAQAACDRAGDRLAWYGFGAHVYQSQVWHEEPEERECFNCGGDLATCCICHGTGTYIGRKSVTLPCIERSHGYYTDGKRFVYVGTQRARGYIAKERKPIQIIIEAGRDPDDSEIDALIFEALGEQAELELAA